MVANVIERFGTVNGIFTTVVFDEGVFDHTLAPVSETVGEMSWRGVLSGRWGDVTGTSDD